MQKILIVEDEIILAVDLNELLSSMGFEIALAHHYDTALALASSFKPDLILCDINLNGPKDGIDLVNELRANNQQFELIYLTAYSAEDIIHRAEITQPFNYLTKPYHDSQVKVAVRLAFNFIQQKLSPSVYHNKLTQMEIKVLSFIAAQKSSKEIAQLLFISDKTVRNHRYNITKKLGLPAGNNTLSKWAIGNFEINGFNN